MSHPQHLVHAHSLQDPESFWSHHTAQLHWHKPPSRALVRQPKTLPSGVTHEHWAWFPDGEISTTYNCVDRHVAAGRGDHAAIIWDSAVTGVQETYTYRRLLDEVEVLAGVLREEGVRKGDVVIIYMPMIPAALIAALAITRLGAIHSAVFGGFAAKSLAQRIEAARPRVVMTASCGIEGSKGPVAYRPLVEGAIAASSFKPFKTLIWQREQLRWDNPDKVSGQRNWQRLVKSARMRGVRAGPVPVKSTDGLYIIYTSGTTGLPKGVYREAGGHAVGLHLSIKYLFDIHGPGDVMFCASDIGWVVGHSYILYGPLLVGATTVLFEGKPVGTPDAGTFWRIVEQHRAKVLFTAPTAMRAIRKDDPDDQFFLQVARRGGLKHFKALFLAGERSEPSIVQAYQKLLTQHAAPGAMVVDNWWSSESGSPISGLALRSVAGLVQQQPQQDGQHTNPAPLRVRPGSAGLPMPGFDVRIVDDDGKEVPRGTMGNIVMAMPLGPTAFTSLFNDDERFYKGYLKRFHGQWMDTGDAGMVDDEGYVHIMSRSDDIINVAAHRFSTGNTPTPPLSLAHGLRMLFTIAITGAIEQAILSHPDIGEASVVGIPDPLKGHLPFAFIQPRDGTGALPARPSAELFAAVNAAVREQIGAIASLGGMIQGRGMIPKTRSGKTLRRVLRELVEQGVRGEFAGTVSIPPTVEDAEVVEVARARVREYFIFSHKAKL
ncbi:putative acyl-CoA synthetase [Aspergillus clavatus NRRL 1]|uniref:Acyl-CoA synthetase, putative n=1 Tax=Aspergillus clavatus (strain ATCC 1007 / CBS 513.65 / DSM 816 / NCTC 3887 / NRRL 1 / QM 1276 / 107) TaxID=344612 RepID=A1CSK5_ASPCL|nr:acyl-CoA synthetase, putative [Aspergillus clavatus NRRL 1]EAW06292.1 acyl-CoA synthetase, putative [Aspergillus clavatus NRRL 1]